MADDRLGRAALVWFARIADRSARVDASMCTRSASGPAPLRPTCNAATLAAEHSASERSVGGLDPRACGGGLSAVDGVGKPAGAAEQRQPGRFGLERDPELAEFLDVG
jgi:hypothetical protein